MHRRLRPVAVSHLIRDDLYNRTEYITGLCNSIICAIVPIKSVYMERVVLHLELSERIETTTKQVGEIGSVSRHVTSQHAQAVRLESGTIHRAAARRGLVGLARGK